MAKRLADLGIAQITQDFLPEHWNWTDDEKKQLGNIDEMGKIIKTRLEKAGCEIQEMYAIEHDKDEKKLWNEYKHAYEIAFTSHHAHFTVNGKKVNIPSYLLKPGDVVEVRDTSRSSAIFKRLVGEDAPVVLVPQWLERDKNALKGTVSRLPVREDINDMPIEEHLIVELYSK